MTGFFGVGGGFVIVPALTLALRLPMPQAIATSLVVISINSGGALLARAGTAHFDWAIIVPFTLAAIAASLPGKMLADRLSGRSLTRAFAVLLVAVAAYTATASIIALAKLEHPGTPGYYGSVFIPPWVSTTPPHPRGPPWHPSH